MMIAIDGLWTETRTLEEILGSHTFKPREVVSEPEVAYRIGFCGNLKGDGGLGTKTPCSSRIMSNDIDALDLPGNKYICGPCLDNLLASNSRPAAPDVRRAKGRGNIVRDPKLPRAKTQDLRV